MLSAKEHFPEAAGTREPLVPQAASGDAAGEGHRAVPNGTAAPAELLPPGYSKAARRKLPPLKSSLKDGLQCVFLILQDSAVRGSVNSEQGPMLLLQPV